MMSHSNCIKSTMSSLRAKRGNPEYLAPNSGLPRFARNDGACKFIVAVCTEGTGALPMNLTICAIIYQASLRGTKQSREQSFEPWIASCLATTRPASSFHLLVPKVLGRSQRPGRKIIFGQSCMRLFACSFVQTANYSST